MIAIAPRDFALLLGITLIWGVNLIVSKIGVAHVPPLMFTAARFLLLGLALLPFLRVRKGQMGALAVASLLSGGFNFGLSFLALRLSDDVASVAIAAQLSVPFTTLLSVALLGEVVRWRRWTGVVLAFAGVLAMGFDAHVLHQSLAIALMVLSSFVGSLGLIAVKKLSGFKPLELQAWLAWFSVPVLLAGSLAFEHQAARQLVEAPLTAWGALAYTAFVGSLIAHTGFYHLVQRYPVASVAPLTVLSPVFSIVLGVLLLGDVLSARIVAGGILTLGGVLIITLRERRIADTGT